MENFTPLSALAGGALIGASATLLLWLNGRIAGVSGIMHGALRSRAGDIWRWLFLLGLVFGAGVWLWLAPPAFAPRAGYPLPLVLLAGVLVGFGTAQGGGSLPVPRYSESAGESAATAPGPASPRCPRRASRRWCSSQEWRSDLFCTSASPRRAARTGCRRPCRRTCPTASWRASLRPRGPAPSPRSSVRVRPHHPSPAGCRASACGRRRFRSYNAPCLPCPAIYACAETLRHRPASPSSGTRPRSPRAG